jgi:hypothetical protein
MFTVTCIVWVAAALFAVMLTTCDPLGAGGFVVVADVEPPPQPVIPAAIPRHSTHSNESLRTFFPARAEPRRRNAPKGKRSAYIDDRESSGLKSLTVEATFKVTTLWTAVVPVTVCDGGFSEQVTYATGLEQAKVTAPANPIAGTAETVTVPEAPGAIDIALGLKDSVSGFVKLSINAPLVDPPKFPAAL